MADTTFQRDPLYRGDAPRQSTLPMRADTLSLAGCFACVDFAGRACNAGTSYSGGAALASACGVFRADFDNRTTAPEGGGAGAIYAEIRHGVFAFLGEAEHLPIVGNACYVADNQTVSTDSDSGARGVAGYCVAVEAINGTTYYFVETSPSVVGQIVIAATEASQLDTAQSDIDAAEADIADLQTDEAMGRISVPLPSFVVASTGLPLATAFNDGVADGLEWSEGLQYRFNPSSTAAIGASVPLPAELDGTAGITIRILASRIGSANADAAITVAAFFQVDGAAIDADADCGGDTGAVAAATTVLDTVTRAIAHGDVPDTGPAVLSFTLVPNADLDGDDLCIHAVLIEYAKTLTAS